MVDRGHQRVSVEGLVAKGLCAWMSFVGKYTAPATSYDYALAHLLQKCSEYTRDFMNSVFGIHVDLNQA